MNVALRQILIFFKYKKNMGALKQQKRTMLARQTDFSRSSFTAFFFMCVQNTFLAVDWSLSTDTVERANINHH